MVSVSIDGAKPVDTACDKHRRFEEELHGLAQPLTTLQCSLEIGLVLGDEASAREALQEGLTELKRILAAVSRLRTIAAAKPIEGKCS